MPRPPRERRTATDLGARVDALASALRDAGVDPARSARLLAAAAAATLDAVALDLILDDASAPAAPLRPAEQPHELAAPLAA